MEDKEAKTPIFDYFEAVTISGFITVYIVSKILKETGKHYGKSLISRIRNACKKCK